MKVSHLHSNHSASRRTHDLRHGTATHALTAGIDIKLVQDLLGHTTSSFTRDTYTSVADEARRTAADTLAAFLTHRDPAPGTAHAA